MGLKGEASRFFLRANNLGKSSKADAIIAYTVPLLLLGEMRMQAA